MGTPEEVTDVVDRGANVNGGYDQSIPVLEVAAAHGKTEIADVLIKAGANINLVRPLGQTALKAAVTRQRIDTLKLLLEKGADVCGKTESSALQYALEANNQAIINMLEEAGARQCK